MKNRTFSEYWRSSKKWFFGLSNGKSISLRNLIEIKEMCRNAYNAGLREGKKKRPRAVKP